MTTRQIVPLLGYAPDRDPAEPGVFSYCYGMEATLRGWKLRRAPISVAATSGAAFTSGSYVLDGEPTGPHVAIYDAGASKFKLYRNSSGTLTDASVAGNYSASTTNFSFAEYGNYMIATNLLDNVQYRDTTTTNAFAATGATSIPKAAIAVRWGPPTSPRLMLLNYNDGTAYTDGWWTSHKGGPLLSWAPDIATGAANGRLLGAGTINCGIAFGDDIIAFSRSDMWRGTFSTDQFIINWQRIGPFGCRGPYCATVLFGILYFLDKRGLFMYDGTYPRLYDVPIQDELRGQVIAVATDNLFQVTSDPQSQRLMIAIRTGGYTSSLAINKWYSINIQNKKVGMLATVATGTTPFQAAFEAGRQAYLVSGADASVKTDQTASTPYLAALNELHGFGLSYFGSDKGHRRVTRVQPRFITAPSSFQMVDYYGDTSAEALSNSVTGVTVSATPWRADMRKSARWHAPRLYFATSANDVEIQDVALDVVDDGVE